jgi:outer membrane autotransporter protein
MSSGGKRGAAARARSLSFLLASTALSALAIATPAAAQDATWLLNPGSGDFNVDANWNPAQVPTGTAFFGQSNTANVFFTLDTTLGGMTFNADAPNYVIANPNQLVTLNGAGIVVNGGSVTIDNADELEFLNSAIAGRATINNTGFLSFFNSSKAGTATINNQFDLTFDNNASADRSTINNSLASITFSGSSKAGDAIINNDGGGVGFFDSSRAGNSTIRTFNGGAVFFFDDSNGDNARLIAEAGSFVDFSGATGVNGVFTVGSIEGAGDFTIGGQHAQFVVGSNNRSTTVSGTIDECGCNLGILVKIGSGQLTLLGNNLYSGGTIIREGSVAAGNNNAVGTGMVTFDGGIFRAAANNLNFVNNFAVNTAGGEIDTNGNTLTISGVIANGNGTSGTLTKSGLGTLILTAQNTYTGATHIDQGALQLNAMNALSNATAVSVAAGASFNLNNFDQTIASLAGAGNVMLGAALLTTGGDNSSTTFSGAISGTGGLTKQGTGTFTLTGISTYTGVTNVNDGILVVNGSLASTVNLNGGALQGTGTVGGLNNPNGTLSPGNSIGTLTVAGNMVLGAAATYLIEVSPSAADRTNVTGTAQLAGTVNAVFANGTYLTRNYTILSAAGGLGGTRFDALTTTNLPAGFEASLNYAGTDVLLTIIGQVGANQLLNRNQANVATGLNAFFNGGGTLPPAFFTVFGLTGAPLGNALTQLSGEHATGIQQASIQSMNLFLNAMLDPFVAGRNGGFGAAMGYAPEEAFAANLPVKAPVTAPTFEQRWSVWGAAYGGRNRTDGEPLTIGSHDLAASAAGFAGGADYRLSPGTVIGAALAMGENRWSVTNLGKGNADVAQVGGYFSTRWNSLYFSGAIAGAWHQADTERTLNVVGTERLQADFNARSIGARVETGWRLAMPTFAGATHALTPYAAVQVQSLRTPNYAERTSFGAGNFALSYARQTTTDTRSELGAWLDGRKLLDSGAQLLLRARAAWVHDFDPGRRINAAFQTLPGGGFTVDGAAAPKNSALTSAAAELRLRNGVTLIGKVDSEFSGRATAYAATGTLKYAW